ncbi:MAG: DUF4440 domain-containing protein [Bryobacteraceae bacterium]|nr:DUF4440 domain-containing protein [Bryobacteraceae bacterium]
MLPEVISDWKGLENTLLDGERNIRLAHLEAQERVPVYSAILDNETSVMIRFFHQPDGTSAIFDRHREATFLSHPNLLPCLGAGFTNLGGEPFVYGIYEAPNTLLSTLLEGKTFSPDETRTLCLDILDGLEYLHSVGLVFCNLDRSTVARCGDQWKLCDYSELRPEGVGYVNETRRLLGALPGAPPEAYSGVVTPSWDCWSVAHLLRTLAQPEQPPTPRNSENGTASRTPRAPRDLAEPFRSVAAACLLPDAGERCTIADIRRQLTASAPQPPIPDPTFPEPVRQPVPRPDPPPGPFPQPDPPPVYTAPAARGRPGAAAILVAAATAVALLVGVSSYLRQNGVKAPAAVKTSSGERNRARVSTEPAAAPAPASEVRKVVDQWAEAFRQRDLEAHMRLYAPSVRRFYLKNNVTTAFVRQTKQSAIQSAGQIRRYEIDNVDTNLTTPSTATVTFDKTWDFAGKTRHTGKVRGELKLEKQSSGTWQIVGERDLKVYRQTRARA